MAKGRVFNIMQYVNHPETNAPLLNEDTIKVALAHRTIKQWAYVLHDKDVYSEADEADDPNHVQGQPKPPHWHIVMNCSQQVEVGTIAKWFGIAENFVDIPKGAGAGKFLDCVEYLTHESFKQQELGKYRYPDEEIHASEGFNWREKLDKRAENKLKYGRDLNIKESLRYDVLYNGMTIREVKEKHPLEYAEDMTYLRKCRAEYLKDTAPTPNMRINFYIEGDGGLGKGIASRAIARVLIDPYHEKTDEELFFQIGADSTTFENYDGQPIIIWNDCRAYTLMQRLGGRENVFNVFDPFPPAIMQNVKYGATKLLNCINIVNSVEDYETFMNGLAGEYTDRNGNFRESEDKSQSYRRFPFFIRLREEDYDFGMNKGMFDGTREYTQWLMLEGIKGSFKNIASSCGTNVKLVNMVNDQTLSPVKEKYEELKDKLVHEQIASDEELLEYFKDYGKQIPKPVQMEVADFISVEEKAPFEYNLNGLEDLEE